MVGTAKDAAAILLRPNTSFGCENEIVLQHHGVTIQWHVLVCWNETELFGSCQGFTVVHDLFDNVGFGYIQTVDLFG